MSETLKYCSEYLRQVAVDQFQCVLTETNRHEMNLEGTEFSLIRTTLDNTLRITVIKDKRKGDITINPTDLSSIDEAIRTVCELAKSAQEDPDQDIAPSQPHAEFSTGPNQADPDRMYQLLKAYSNQVPAAFPQIKLMESSLVFTHEVARFINSNGVQFTGTKGMYSMMTVFSSKEGDKTSSFNYTAFSLKQLERELLDCASLRNLMQQSVEHLHARLLQGKFVGDVVITPDCLSDIIQYYVYSYLSDRALIAGTSLLKDKLGEQVAHRKLTLAARPLSPELANGYFFTPDGFAAEDVTIIERGVLKSFLLSLYGANKTKRERAKNVGGCFVVEPGDKTFAEIIKGIERGIVVARYSGGNPSANGDFSGVAKNSYYIEHGEIKYPVRETMIAGNLAELFNNIKEVSSERVNFGSALLPYLHASGVTISGR